MTDFEKMREEHDRLVGELRAANYLLRMEDLEVRRTEEVTDQQWKDPEALAPFMTSAIRAVDARVETKKMTLGLVMNHRDYADLRKWARDVLEIPAGSRGRRMAVWSGNLPVPIEVFLTNRIPLGKVAVVSFEGQRPLRQAHILINR